MKNKMILPLMLLSITLVGCGKKGGSNSVSQGGNSSTTQNSTSSSTSTTFDYKEKKGTGVIFDEEQGINTRDASVFEENNTRYVVYTASKEKNSSLNVIAARSATKVSGEWNYGERHDILLPSQDGWDTNIGNPSIIKGSFLKGQVTYKYLMAYEGNNNANNQNYQIGLAVSNDVLSGWQRVGDEPIITYDNDTFGNAYGCGAPSLVSYNQQGQVYMMYSYGEVNLSNARVVDCDFSNLDNIIIDRGTRQIQVDGLIDDGNDTILANADFALNSQGELYVVRDVFPLSSVAPNCANKVEVAKANIGILNAFDKHSWTHIDNIETFDTMDFEDDDSLGWDEIYSGAFVTNEYGVLIDDSNIEIIYSTYNEQESATDLKYKFSAQLCSYTIEVM